MATSNHVRPADLRSFIENKNAIAFDLLSENDRKWCRHWCDHETPRWADMLGLALRDSPKRLLDIGCEFAVYDFFMRQQLQLSVQGLDSPANCKKLKDYWSKQDFQVVSCDLIREDPSLEKDAFDTIIASEIIEHIPVSPRKILAKLLPLLRPGGRLVVTTPNVHRMSNIFRLLKGENVYPEVEQLKMAFDESNPAYWTHAREYSPREIGDELEHAGFSDIEIKMSSCWEGPYSSGKRSIRRRILKSAWLPISFLLPGYRGCIMATGIRPTVNP